jgi:hypothetical protein
MSTLQTLRASLSNAAWNKETTTIGGGLYSPDEIERAVYAIDATDAVVAMLADVLLALENGGLKCPKEWEASLRRTLNNWKEAQL